MLKTEKEKMILGVVGVVIATLFVIYELDVAHVHIYVLTPYLAFINTFSRVLDEVNINKATAPKDETRAEKITRIFDIVMLTLEIVSMVLYLFI